MWNCCAGRVKVQTVTTGETFGADEALLNRVKQEVKLEGTNQDGHIVLLFCPISSRVGSDVEAAMKKVSDDDRVILVLMHHTRDIDYSTSGRLWSEAYPNIDLDVHVLYHESVHGLLICPMNTEAVRKLVKFLKPKKCQRLRRLWRWICCCA